MWALSRFSERLLIANCAEMAEHCVLQLESFLAGLQSGELELTDEMRGRILLEAALAREYLRRLVGAGNLVWRHAVIDGNCRSESEELGRRLRDLDAWLCEMGVRRPYV